MNDRNPVNLRCSMIVFSEDRVLLCHRAEEDVWVLPGGTPRPGEGSAPAASREVAEETGLKVDAERVAFVLEATNADDDQHLIEIVFVGSVRDRADHSVQVEPHLTPAFVELDRLGVIGLRPPIAGYIRGLALDLGVRRDLRRFTGAYLGNVWRPVR
jgi:8-oxo-dGTP diphosphatase